MCSINFPRAFALPPSHPSKAIACYKTPSIRSTKLAQTPSGVSLKLSHPLKTPEIQQGRLKNLHLVSLSKQGKLKEAREFVKKMDEAGVSVVLQSFQCLFEACRKAKSISDGRFFHDWMRRTVKNQSVFLQNCALEMYCECGTLLDAQKMFDEMVDRNLVSWVMIISGYAQKGRLDKAFALFSDMLELGMRPNSFAYNTLLRALVNPPLLGIGKQIHSHVMRSGLGSDVLIDTAISNMYVKCGWFEGAELVFDRMVEKNAVTWTGLMVGYTQANKQKDALDLFGKMLMKGVELDEFVFSIALKACAGLEDLSLGRQIHGYVVKLGLESEVSVGTPLVDFYVKCANFESACKAFEGIIEPNDVSWSALITGYCQMGGFEESVKIFKSLRSKGANLNSFIYTSIFQACAALADFNLGPQAHADGIKRGLVECRYGESAMITMYARNGRLDYANRAFESLDEPDTVAWTALISGYAYHGNAPEALKLFRRMQDHGVRPNAVTLVAIFTACSHSGLVMEAKHYLEFMRDEYGVEPTIDHYNCMIDIYSRAGLLDQALELLKGMPFEPDAMSWKCLLGGCWAHKNLELGRIAANNLLQLDPNDTASYVLLFNLYASSGQWEEAANVRKMMAERNLRKELSCSWISVNGKVHRFIVGDKHHPQTEEIYSKLKEFNHSAADNLNEVLTEEDISCSLPERKEQLLDHSERLAIAFGLISTPSNAPIMVFKNLRACRDCHDFAKHVSLVTGREIVVRDACRFHHFEFGKCSCKDYW